MTVGEVIHLVSKELETIPGIVGVVLGGSRARDTHRPDSDIDIGIYYDEVAGFDTNAVGKAATKLDDENRKNLVTSLGEWGSWINGGGWIVVEGYHVDLIFRDVNRVETVIEDCLSGSISSHYHTGHPHAYLNVMYMGEISICSIVADPTNQLAALQAKTIPYPESLKDAIIGYFMFEASFSFMFADDNVDKDDISYVAGHCFRVVSCLNQVLFAANETYCINEKKAVAMVEHFSIKPKNYKERIDNAIRLLSSDKNNTRKGVNLLGQLVTETEQLLDKN
ncbi:putative nucleotidyltransferase [Virgibacillus natechei]|uniref:Nucleotidyltransferase n=1 Tax=Virgibacillus natechei TaxID=1216297 RepID=A0ABS4IBQ1_9BACI|nr:nucleotidyltransferase domain-containing protein [Virgibacillus natechei]MBP1968358.1 putative nucleotidyltransferase [Virgibacillus natechei]UZD13489.1 nucleotidyltransferase domain-containing protein [Virgibacillus natechei]